MADRKMADRKMADRKIKKDHLPVSHLPISHFSVSHFSVSNFSVSHFSVSHFSVRHFSVRILIHPYNRKIFGAVQVLDGFLHLSNRGQRKQPASMVLSRSQKSKEKLYECPEDFLSL